MQTYDRTSSDTPKTIKRMFRPIAAAQLGADPDRTREMELLWMSPDVQMALRGVQGEFLRLSSTAGDLHFLEIARERAEDSSPDAIVAALTEIRENLTAERDIVRDELEQWNSSLAAAQLATQPFEFAANDARLAAEQRLSCVRALLASAADEQLASRRRLQDAGLSLEDIEKIGVRPSNADVDAWKGEVMRLQGQISRIDRFFASRPFCDVTLLTGADLATFSRWRDRLGIVTQPSAG